METTIGEPGDFCDDCQAAGCEPDSECQAEHAYGEDEDKADTKRARAVRASEGGYHDVDLQALGEKMLHWHGSMGDPIYAVGSYFFSGKRHPQEGMEEKALSEFEKLLSLAETPEGAAHGGWSDDDVQELRDICDELQEVVDSGPENKQAAAKVAAAFDPKSAMLYFDIHMEDINIEEDAKGPESPNHDLAKSLMNDGGQKAHKLEGDAMAEVKKIFGKNFSNEGHDNYGDLVCKVPVSSIEEVEKILSKVSVGGGDDIHYLNTPYCTMQNFTFFPNGVNDDQVKFVDFDEWKEEQADTKQARVAHTRAANVARLKRHAAAARLIKVAKALMKVAAQSFLDAYMETALWSSTDESDESGGEPMDKNYTVSDITSETKDKMAADCERFQSENAENLTASGLSDDMAGYCFWLSRNGSGVGFFDRDAKDETAQTALDELQEAARDFQSFSLLVDDNGKIDGLIG